MTQYSALLSSSPNIGPPAWHPPLGAAQWSPSIDPAWPLSAWLYSTSLEGLLVLKCQDLQWIWSEQKLSSGLFVASHTNSINHSVFQLKPDQNDALQYDRHGLWTAKSFNLQLTRLSLKYTAWFLMKFIIPHYLQCYCKPHWGLIAGSRGLQISTFKGDHHRASQAELSQSQQLRSLWRNVGILQFNFLHSNRPGAKVIHLAVKSSE